MNEDSLRILRMQQVLDASGHVLYDTEVGHDDESVEMAIDEVNVEYLDLLLDLTGDEFMGSQILGGLSTGRARA
jgi:predicted oxidoreductase